jgi:membrane associated rhomboid family serine protease
MLPLWDSHKLKRPGVVTRWLVILNLLIFGLEAGLSLLSPELFGRLLSNYALVPREWWAQKDSLVGWIPVVTSMFLHGGLAHVAGNGWFLWVFGRSLEDHVGAIGFGCIYLLAGLGAALAQAGMDIDSSVPMIGASGAISGVLGAYLVLLSGRWIVALVPWIVPIVPIPAVVFLVLWFAMQLMNGIGGLGNASEGGVAWWAHVGGFATGVMLGKLGVTNTQSSRKVKR